MHPKSTEVGGALSTRRTAMKLFLTSASVVVLGGCRILGIEKVKYRFRLTVEVDTPQGLRVGSSVVEVETDVSYGRHDRIHGDAVSVELPDNQTLFVLLNGSGDFAGYALDPNGDKSRGVELFDTGNGGRDWLNDYLRELVKNRQLVDIPHYAREKESNGEVRVGAGQTSIWPPMLRFRDPKNQSTVEQVDPDRLDLFFGNGVRIKRITFQITDDKVSRGLKNRLPYSERNKFTRIRMNTPHGPDERLISINTFVFGE